MTRQKRGVLICFSVAGIKHRPEATWGGKGWFHLTVPNSSSTSRKHQAGACKQEVKQGLQNNTVYWHTSHYYAAWLLNKIIVSLCIYGHTHAIECLVTGQLCGIDSLFPHWVPGSHLKSPDLCGKHFTCWAILPNISSIYLYSFSESY